jgi:leucyl/phenylalanyl-tRNA--protein transferase
MAIESFPPVETADEDGLLAIGGDLEPASVIAAYQSGIFPWPLNARTLAWFSPPERGVLFIDEFHISRRLREQLKKSQFQTKVDADFAGVIARCAEVKNRGKQRSTWITRPMREAYMELHRLGIAHSFESYLNGELVGGLYGVQLGHFFAAESSFYRVSNASKAAMVRLVEYLRDLGVTWLDCQVLTPFSESFGARAIPREEFMTMLAKALK